MNSDPENQIQGIGSTDDENRPPASAQNEGAWSSRLRSCLRNNHKAVEVAATLLIPLALVLQPVWSPIESMVHFSFHSCGNAKEVSATSSSPEVMRISAVYDKSRHKRTRTHRATLGSWTLIARLGLLLLAWLVLNVSVPSLRRVTLMGSPLWRWSLLAVTLTVGYFGAMGIYLIPDDFRRMTETVKKLTLHQIKIPKMSNSRYFYFSLLSDMTLVIYFVMVLVSWLFYFGTERGLKHASTPHQLAFDYVTWTCVSLFIASVILFFKTLFLEKWCVDAIYRRFERRILITGVKLVYLRLIFGGFLEDQVVTQLELLEEYAKQSTSASFSYTSYIMSKKLSLNYLIRVGLSLEFLVTVVRPLKDDGVPDVLDFFRNNIPQTADTCEVDSLLDLLRSTVQPAQFKSKEHRIGIAGVLCVVVKEQLDLETITFDDLKKWMVDAHKNCVNMGRTLADARAMVIRLNRFILFIVFIAVVFLWLLITGIATTTVLVTIATPLLAFTFIFGDSAKSFFQGIIFCFATHIFDVGDRCIIDGLELEVISIGILTTLFTKIGTKEKVMYPNSVLATKATVNLGWEPDPTDVLELTLDFSTTATELQKLETKMQEFFNDAQQKVLFENKHKVMMKEIGDKIKVSIHYTNVLNIEEMTHGECVLKKNEQRSILLKKIYQILDQRSTAEPINDHRG